jgi:hypothetical protein
MNSNQRSEEPLVMSYLELRRAIGILGIALPIVLVLGVLIIYQTDLQSSISSYYHTGMRDVLVGTLVAVGLFLYSYKGYPGDAIYGKIACASAIGVALFPATPDGKIACASAIGVSLFPTTPYNPRTALILGYFHLFFTIAFFATLVYFSYFLFTKSDQDSLPPKKRQRNLVYRICGVLMAICILGIVLVFFLPSAAAWLGGYAVFCLETAAIWAFGVSWFVKGEALNMLNDPVVPEGEAQE